MPTDEQILQTLKRMESLMKGSSSLAGGAQTAAIGGGSTPRNQVSADRSNAGQDKAMRQSVIATTKVLDRFGDKAARGAYSLSQFTKNTDAGSTGIRGFTGELGRAVTQFTAARSELSKVNLTSTMDNLEKAVETAAQSIKNTSVGRVNTANLSDNLNKLDDVLEKRINPRFNVMRLNLRAANTAIDEFRAKLSNSRTGEAEDLKTLGKGLGIVVSSISRAGGIGTQFERMTLLMKALNAQLRAARGNMKRGGTGGGGGGGGGRGRDTDSEDPKDLDGSSKKATSIWKQVFSRSTILGAGILAFLHEIGRVVEDAYEVTAARGYGTTDSLGTLYKNAILAGMSLREYAQMMDQNMGLVSRSSSFAAFDKQLDVGRDALAKFGVFGADATKLSAAMASSAQSLGVPVTDLSKSMNGQMTVFEQLRKTTGLTADAMAELLANLRESEVVQKELLGLAPSERQARYTELVQITSWGKQLGLSENAQRALTESILAARKSTVKERFQQRGRLGQAFSLVGMGDKSARVQELASKRNKTEEETKEYTRLLGEYSQKAEELKQTGGPGMQYQTEVMDEKLREAGLGSAIDAAGQVRAAEQTGPQNNKDLGKKLDGALGKIEQYLGKALAILEGIRANPLAIAALGLIGTAVAFAASGTYLKIQASMIGAAVARALGPMLGRGAGGHAYGTPDDFVGPKKPEPEKGPLKDRIKGRAGKMAGAMRGMRGVGIAGAATGVLATGMAVYDYNNAAEAAKEENGGDGDVGKAKGEAIGSGIGGLVGTIGGMFLGPLGAAIGGAAGSYIGGLIGGFFGKESAQEKATKELKRNTDELIKQRREGAGENVISSTNLGSLTENVLQTAKAYAPPTAKEVAEYAESKKTPEQKKKEADEKAKAKDDAVRAEEAAQQGQAIDEMNGTPMSATASGIELATAGSSLAKANAASLNKPPLLSDKDISLGIPKPMTAEELGLKKVAQASMVASSAQSIIATPAMLAPTSVIPTTVNTAAQQVQAEVPSPKSAATALTSPGTDQTNTLQQILAVLQQSLSIENQQVDLASQLLRLPAFQARLPDNQFMVKRALAQT